MSDYTIICKIAWLDYPLLIYSMVFSLVAITSVYLQLPSLTSVLWAPQLTPPGCSCIGGFQTLTLACLEVAMLVRLARLARLVRLGYLGYARLVRLV